MKKDLPRLSYFISLVIIIWVSSPIIIRYLFQNWQCAGLFGDSFGAVNSLFSGLAFAAIIYTIYVQKNELLETRKQIEVQKFEGTFFNLLNLHQSILKNVTISVDDKEFQGVKCMQYLQNQLKDNFSAKLTSLDQLNEYSLGSHRSAVMNVFSTLYNSHEDKLAYSFKSLVNIGRIIKESRLFSKTEKEFYYEIVRTQIHPCEAALLFYYLNLGFGPKDLVIEMSLSRSIMSALLAEESHRFLFYPDEQVKEMTANK